MAENGRVPDETVPDGWNSPEGSDSTLPAGSEILYSGRTDYAEARIERDPACSSGRLLFLDGVAASYIDLDDADHLEFLYIQRFAAMLGVLWPEPQPLRVTHVGGAAASLARYLGESRPHSSQLVYEYDGALVELARRELGLLTFPGLKVKTGDARARMDRRSPGSADVVIGDAFVGRKVPEALRGTDYLSQVANVLADGGVYLLNTIEGPDLFGARRHAATLQRQFRTVFCTTDPDVLAGRNSGNVLFLATDREKFTFPLGALVRVCTTGSYPDQVIRPDEIADFIGDAQPYPG
nr:fused MFS/spermidine synthase [Nakamurella aerolata]